MNKRKISSLTLTLALALSPAALMSGCSGGISEGSSAETAQPDGNNSSTAAENPDFHLADNIEDGVILHAWCWDFNTIKESMGDIAAAGYTSIQTSPANAVIEGGDGGMQLMGKGKWYYQYQPTDWTIGNYQLGTEDEFKAMCEEADQYGIKIIVDVVPNHTAADKSAVLQSFIDAVGGEDKLYHKNADKGINNYSDRLECTTYSLTGLPDVNTENPQFQEYFISYLNKLIADGADGFRYDTAKHIGLPDDPQEDSSLPNNFWEQVTTKTDNADSIFNYGEVLQGSGERIEDYIKAIGHTTASSYGSSVRACLDTGKFKASSLDDFKVGGSNNVVTWVESHDTYTDSSSLKYTDEEIILGWAVIAANGKGTPLFFDRPYGASQDNQWGMNRIGAAGSDLYKDPSVTAVNHFRNAMTGEDTEMTNPDAELKNNLLMIARGTKGAVLVSGAKSDGNINAETSLADGTYTDRTGVNGDFVVSGGKLSGTIKSHSVAVLYNEGYTAPVEAAAVRAETDSFLITDDSVQVTLHVSGADKGTYSVNGESGEYTDGDVIDVKPDDNGEAALKLSAVGSSGITSTMTYWFTKAVTASEGAEITFEKPSSWGDTVYVYIYDETVKPVAVNADWPGEAMTKNGSSYTYQMTKQWNSALVIFSDGGNHQYPAPMEPGELLEAGKTYSPSGS